MNGSIIKHDGILGEFFPEFAWDPHRISLELSRGPNVIISLTADCQSVKRQPQHASHCQWQSVAAAFVLFFANGTNIVANWVKKRHKVKEDSSNIFKIAKNWQTLAKGSTTKKQDKVEQILHCLKVAKIGKMWYKQTVAKSGINFTLSFNGNYWHKKSVKN